MNPWQRRIKFGIFIDNQAELGSFVLYRGVHDGDDHVLILYRLDMGTAAAKVFQSFSRTFSIGLVQT